MQRIRELLVRLQSQDQHQHLFPQAFLRPDIVCRENAVLLYQQPIERRLNVLGINVLPAFGDDHVLLAPEQLQMSLAVEPAQITRQQPSVHDRLRGQFRIIEIVRHHRAALHRNFSDPVLIRTHHSHFRPGKRLAYAIRAKRFQIVDGDRGARLRQPISIGHRNSKIVEKLQRRRIRKCPAHNQRAHFTAKRLVHLRQQLAAQLHPWPALGEQLVQPDQPIQNPSLRRWQLVKLGAQPALQVLQHHRHQAHVGDAVAHQCIPDKLRTQRP